MTQNNYSKNGNFNENMCNSKSSIIDKNIFKKQEKTGNSEYKQEQQTAHAINTSHQICIVGQMNVCRGYNGSRGEQTPTIFKRFIKQRIRTPL